MITIEQIQPSNENVKENTIEKENPHSHTNCVDKKVLLTFLDECKACPAPNQTNDVTLVKLINAITRLADIIRGPKSSTKEIVPPEITPTCLSK
jgi:hypothetical protein